jgi:23S rRNA-/tRNA-specific pseudouridylate synthase
MEDSSLCLIQSFNTLKEGLKGLGISANQLKKFNLAKKLRQEMNPKVPVKLSLNLLNHGLINPQYQGPEIELIKQDARVLIINKPFNIHSLPQSYLEQNNCLSFLREHLLLKNSEFCFHRDFEQGLLFRLDYHTSGLLFFAKKITDYQQIRKNFKKAALTKQYLAIVEGKLTQEKSLKQFFLPWGNKGSKMKIIPSFKKGAREGVMNLTPLDYHLKEDLTLLQVTLKEGIRHQIRAGLGGLGYPILGDITYGGREHKRLYLHAYHYAIYFPGQIYDFTAHQAPLFDHFFDPKRFV